MRPKAPSAARRRRRALRPLAAGPATALLRRARALLAARPAALALALAAACGGSGRTGDAEAPLARLTAYPTSGLAPLDVRFDGSDSRDNVGVVEWRWDFGDGATGSGAFADHRYRVRGIYPATLTVLDAAGNSGVAQQIITATGPLDVTPPHAVLAATPRSGLAPLRVHFDASASTDDLGVTDSLLDFGDGQRGQGSALDHVYASAGNFTATLIVRDAAGNSDTAQATITVLAPAVDEAPPRAALRLSTSFGAAPLTVHADASASSDDVGITRYRYDFGDGRTAEGPVQDFVEAVAGRYRVVLTVWDAAGNSNSASETIEVDAPAAQVDQHLYDDALVASWQDWSASWAQSYDLAATSPVHSGARSIRLGLQGYQGLHFHDASGLDATGYDRISLWIHGGGAGGQALFAALEVAGAITQRVSVSAYLQGGVTSVQANRWVQVLIPLSAFAPSTNRLDGFLIQDGSGTSQPDVYLDDLTIYPELGEPLPAPCAPLPPITGFVSRSGAALYVGASAYKAAGANLYYLQSSLARAQQLNETASLQKAREALDDLTCLHLPVARTWAMNTHTAAEDPGAIETAPGVYREEGLAAVDQTVAEAKARGIRLIISLQNNWADYGGIPRYAAWAGKSHDDFFTDAQMKGWWKSYASMLLSRVNTYTGIAYKDEPAILAWEIANELRCTSCAGGTALPDAVGELAAHLRSIAPNQLVADGGEGFDDDASRWPGLSNNWPVSGSQGASYGRLGALAGLDLLSAHFYPVSWGLDPSSDAQVWIDRHQALAAEAGKVFYLGEYGYAAADAARAQRFDAWNDRLYRINGAALGFLWQIMPSGLTDSQGYATYYPGDIATNQVLWKWGSGL